MGLTTEEKKKKRIIVSMQAKEYMNRLCKPTMLRITCGDCGKKVNAFVMFQCFYCGIYFCKSCAEEHFKTEKQG